ncbi:PIN domain-containing protein [Kribbella sp. CA-293567]|uniref:PIN domain-containing protein n=1 Tax=Kribbella sp. CA-293567 TaxID=3002436 RepID=UPI0022DE1B11|nr:PIN domain-containing protein [Kribbella sp. CA-293567]WBQ01830.1 PIN domain-containing protein [Kribbella sp. CA-293567]
MGRRRLAEQRLTSMATVRTAFLDANVVRGQLTTDIMLTLAAERLYRPKWSPEVQAEAIRNKPPGASEQAVTGRFAQMDKVFPAAMTTGYDELTPQMRADEKDKHVLAAAVHSKADVLVTENTKDFDPPRSGSHAMKVERTSEFLNQVLDDNPDKVVRSLQKMVARNRRTPQTMPELIDKMATQQDLEGFAHKLNGIVPPEQRGTHPNLQTTQAAKAALDGVASPTKAAEKPGSAPQARKAGASGPEKSADKEL